MLFTCLLYEFAYGIYTYIFIRIYLRIKDSQLGLRTSTYDISLVSCTLPTRYSRILDPEKAVRTA